MRIVETNSGNDSEKVFFGFKGDDLIWPMAGLMISILLLQLFGSASKSILEVLLCFTPLWLVILYFAFLRMGKPKGYDFDFLEKVFLGERSSLKNTAIKSEVERDGRF